MKDQKKIKGLVVDEYVDRVIFSTVEGEETILRENIEDIEYDTPEQNFMQLGRAYDDKGWYNKASFYYKKALELNPDYEEAREAYLASHTKMWREEDKRTRQELERKSMTMEWRENKDKDVFSPGKSNEASLLKLKENLGISLAAKDGFFTIDDVVSLSPAEKSGINKGDTLVGIWGKLIRYSSMEEVIGELLGPKYSEVRVLIEKEVSISVDTNGEDAYKQIGVILDFEYEGLKIKDITPGHRGDTAGLKKGDFVLDVDGSVTRYLPLDGIIALIDNAKNKESIVFTVRRVINLRSE
ncbi:MAG: PDZ domain-containing protein [Candidatus Omnitrophota bacterium]|nr:PDZ domain-containing protein [Candidatus Omnitrophota bacterium]